MRKNNLYLQWAFWGVFMITIVGCHPSSVDPEPQEPALQEPEIAVNDTEAEPSLEDDYAYDDLSETGWLGLKHYKYKVLYPFGTHDPGAESLLDVITGETYSFDTYTETGSDAIFHIDFFYHYYLNQSGEEHIKIQSDSEYGSVNITEMKEADITVEEFDAIYDLSEEEAIFYIKKVFDNNPSPTGRVVQIEKQSIISFRLDASRKARTGIMKVYNLKKGMGGHIALEIWLNP